MLALPDTWSGLTKRRMVNERMFEWDGLDFLIEYDWFSAEPQTRDHPGQAAYAEITSVKVRPHGYSAWIETELHNWPAKGSILDYFEEEIIARHE